MDIRDRILEKTDELFMQFGIKTITMDVIATELGMSKKTIYQYFSDKEELVRHFATKRFEAEKVQFEAIFNASQNAMDEVFRISAHIRRLLRHINPVLMHDLKKYHPDAYSLFQEHKKQCYSDSLKNSLRRGMEEGYFRADLNVEIMVKMRMETVEMGFDPSIFPPEQFDFYVVQMQMFDHFIHGVSTPKGQQAYHEYRQNNP